MIISALAFSFA